MGGREMGDGVGCSARGDLTVPKTKSLAKKSYSEPKARHVNVSKPHTPGNDFYAYHWLAGGSFASNPCAPWHNLQTALKQLHLGGLCQTVWHTADRTMSSITLKNRSGRCISKHTQAT